MPILYEAARIAKFDPYSVELALIVGALSNLKDWTLKDGNTLAPGHFGACEWLQEIGEALIEEYEKTQLE